MPPSFFSKIVGDKLFVFHPSKNAVIKANKSVQPADLQKKIAKIFGEEISNEQARKLIKNPKSGDLEVLEMEITATCNLRCKHCYQGDAKFKYGPIPTELLTQAIEDGNNLGAYELIITGGEPLTHPGFFDIIKSARENNYRISIVTNGTLIDDEVVKRLVEAEVYRVAISIDGFEETHDLKRGKGMWKRSISAIKKLVANGINVTTPVTVDATNINEIMELAQFLRNIGVGKVIFMLTADVGYAQEHMDLFRIKDHNSELIRELYRSMARPRCKGLHTPPERTCWIFFGELSIGYDGKIYPCTSFKNYKLMPIGNIYDDRLTDIYYNEDLRQLFSFTIADTECAKCPFLAECGAGCRARAYRKTGNIRGRDPFACFVFRGEMSGEIDPHDLIW